MNQLINILVIGICVGTISNTVSRTKVFKSFRLAVYRRNQWFGELFRCPYCLSHWVAFAAVAFFGPQWRLTGTYSDYVTDAFVLIFIASCAGGFIRLSFKGMMPSDPEEIEAIDEAREREKLSAYQRMLETGQSELAAAKQAAAVQTAADID